MDISNQISEKGHIQTNIGLIEWIIPMFSLKEGAQIEYLMYLSNDTN